MRHVLLIMLLSACLGACGKKPNLLEQPAHQNIPSYPAAEPVLN